jgi:hypothetical protein
MADRLDERAAFLLKIESTYGTDPTPTGAADALYCYGLKVDPMENEDDKRSPVRPFFGQDSTVIGGTKSKVEFSIPIAGTGAAGTALPAAFAAAYRAAGHSQVNNPGVDTIYGLVSTAFESSAGYYYDDGVLHKVLGIRGSVSREFKHEAMPLLKFTGLGLYSAPTDTALPTLTFPATWQKPLVQNKVNTTFTLGGVAAVLESLSIDDGTVYVWKDYVNSAADVRITDRPLVKGKVSVQADTIAFKDWFTIAKTGNPIVLALVHGTTAGNKYKLDAANVLPKNPTRSIKDGIVFYDMDLEFYPSSAGNDEIVERVL